MEFESLLPDVRGNSRNGSKAALDGTEVEAGTADENGQPPGCCRRRDLVEGHPLPAGGRATLGRIEKTIEPMRRPLFGRRVGTRRQNAEVAIDLLAIGI